MGASTYEWVRHHLAESGEGWPYPQPTWVLTHRDLPRVPGADLTFATADTAAEVRRLHATLVDAADGRDVWVVGGGGVAAALAAEGLLDALVVAIAPVTLGAGMPLLPGAFDLRLESVERNRAFVAARYAVVGPR
nr:dihydrofolate reductase family protein [Nocardioides perillae]